MTIKAFLYIFTVPMVLFALSSLNYEKFLKANKVTQARLLFLIIALVLSYLLVNFFYDFFLNSQIV